MSNTATMSARERVEALVDANSFVEIGALVTKRSTDFNMQEKTVPADGVITGYGTVDSNLVYVYSQDVTAMKGSVGEMHAKKIAGLYDMAVKMGAPVIGLIDCAGLRLQEATDALAGFGEIYLSQTKASGVVPQISAILGSCGGGVAISSVISDFTIMEKENGKLFVNSPNAVEGNKTETCDTSSAEFQAEAGTVDFVCENEADVFAQIRTLISLLPANNENDAFAEGTEDDMNRTLDNFEGAVKDPAVALTQIADGNRFIETKASFGKDMVTGLMSLNGITVGAVANRTAEFDGNGKAVKEYAGVLTTDGCVKAADFVKFCDAFGIPVVTFTNVNGYAASMEEEKSVARAAAKLTYTFANADIPKVNVIVGNAFGSAYVTMNSKHIGADLCFALPNAKIGMMDAKVAAQIMLEDEIAKADDTKAALEEKAAEYEKLQNDVECAAKRGYVDSIIEGAAVRKHLIYSIDMLYSKRETAPYKKHGTV
ncbi:MAG: carboxyl transferase [Lachnospiraceae bacterium]|nr:carboxyl transferase [Lachnospiraceae bacterium]